METDILKNTGDLLKDAKAIIEQMRQEAFRSVNRSLIQRNWMLGKRIEEEILRGEKRANYGSEVIKKLSSELTDIYGKGFNKNNLYAFVQFYKIFPTLSGKSELLSWSHYMLLLSVTDEKARLWYANEAFAETWSVRTLTYQTALTLKKMYDELKRTEGDNPTMGLILCSQTSADIARFSILKENKQLFQAKYLTFLPTEEQLRQEIERQKEIFLQQEEEKNMKDLYGEE